MKRVQSTNRAPSPTPTAFSGISNYRTDSYRPMPRDKTNSNVPQLPPSDSRAIARTHFDELSAYLASYLARSPPESRSSARQKLTRLTKQQFQELSTDVYDELVRRKKNTAQNEVPFLPVRDDFHPKRNQARQKLATLPTSRFEDLSSDVYYELARRYPEFKEDGDPSSTSDAAPQTYSPYSPRSDTQPPLPRSGRLSTDRDRGADSGYGGSANESSNPRRSDDHPPQLPPLSALRRPSQDTGGTPPPRRSEDTQRSVGGGGGGGGAGEYQRRPSAATSISIHSDSTGATNAQSGTATSAMIIPNKSTIAEEDIEVPYGRRLQVRDSSAADDASAGGGFRDRDREEREASLERPDTDVDDGSEFKHGDGGDRGMSPVIGLSGLSARLRGTADAEDEDPGGGGGRVANMDGGEDYYDKMSLGRTSVTSDRSAGLAPRSMGRTSVTGGGGGEDADRVRREYEFKIATMQARIAGLEREVQGGGGQRVRGMEEELGRMRERADEQSERMRTLQRELDEMRDLRSREKERESRRARDDEDELAILRERCERLEAERAGAAAAGTADLDVVEQLRSDMEGLLSELGDLSRRNDELMAAKEADGALVRELDAQLREYKRKYEQAKTELRAAKATSQLYVAAPKLDSAIDQLPVTPGGALVDVHVTAFISAIDSLLAAGRSHAPTRVLAPTKAVVTAVTAITEDVRAFAASQSPSSPPSGVDLDHLRALRERAEATLGNLVVASKTHATGAGMSPVSLLDAAASHVSATVGELGKLVGVRRASRAEQEEFAVSASASAGAGVGMGMGAGGVSSASSPLMAAAGLGTGVGVGVGGSFSPSLRSLDEIRNGGTYAYAHERSGSRGSTGSGSTGMGAGGGMASPFSAAQRALDRTNANSTVRQNGGGEYASSPPPMFDSPRGVAGATASEETAPEDAWTELKPYLEAQTESIVYAIQAVLSGVRSPVPPPSLNENLTQIITIVSSIVAVCKDNLPPSSAGAGREILRELGEHANRLSEVQSVEVSKETRQVMAKSSFAVANAMKGLMKL